MKGISLRGSRYSGNTIVSNYFIDEYLSEANEAQIKIYLYLMRCIEADEPVSVPLIADRFNYSEKDILRALKYWARKRLVSLEFDLEGGVSGIVLNDPKEAIQASQAGEAEAAIPAEALGQPEPAHKTAHAKGPGERRPSAPAYSAEQLKAFRTRSDIRGLVFAAEQYLSKTLTVTELNSILYMSEELRFSADLIEYLIEYCVSGGKTSMRYIEQTALGWSDDGIRSLEEAKHYTRFHNADNYAVLKCFGITGRNPVESEVRYIETWKNEYEFPMEIIQEAVSRTMKSLAHPSFAYCDSILHRWYVAGVKDLRGIEALDEKRKTGTDGARDAREPFVAVGGSRSGVKGGVRRSFQNERSYDYDKLEEELLNRRK